MNAIQKKRAEYERQVAAIQAKLAVLAELEAELGGPPAAPDVPVAIAPPLSPPVLTTPVTAAEVPAGNVPGPPPNRPPGKPVERLALALSGGPLRVQEVADRAGCSEAAASQSLRNHELLFIKVSPANRMSPWQLTEAGRQLASRLTPAPAT